MKALFQYVFFAFLAIFIVFAGACSSKKSLVSRPSLDKNWKLIHLPGTPDNLLKENEITLDLSSKKGNRYTTTMGCATFSLSAHFSDKGKVQMKNIDKTEFSCEENEAFQEEYIALLKDAKGYTLHGNYLIIDTHQGRDLTFAIKE